MSAIRSVPRARSATPRASTAGAAATAGTVVTAAASAAALLIATVGASSAAANETGNVEVSVMLASTSFFGPPEDDPWPPAVVEVYDAAGDGLEPVATFDATANSIDMGVPIDLPPGQYRIRASADGYLPTWAGIVTDGGEESGQELIGLIDAYHPFRGAIGFEDSPVVSVEDGDESTDAPAHVGVLAGASTSYVGGVVFADVGWGGFVEDVDLEVALFRVGQGVPVRTLAADRGIYVFDDVAAGSYQVRFTFGDQEQWWPYEADRSRAGVLPVTSAGGGWAAIDAAFQSPQVAQPGEYLAITGDPVEGGVLTLSETMPAPFDSAELATTDRLSRIAWFVGDEQVAGATGTTFVVPASAVGEEISATAEGTQLLGYDRRALEASPVGPVSEATLPPIAPAPVPVVAGTPQVGQQLTTTIGTWQGGTTRTFQWHRDGVPIVGATARSYTLKGVDAGASLTFAVTGSRPGSQVTVRTSAPTAEIAPAVFATPGAVLKTDRMASTPRVGDEIRAVHGSWSPAAESWSYEWLRDGVPVDGASGDRYAIGVDDLGATLAVRITGGRLGYVEASASSPSTGIVTEGRFAADRPTVSPAPQVGVTSTADLGVWDPVPESVEIRWMRGQVVLGTGPSYTPTAADANRNLRVVVTGSSAGYLTAERSSLAVPVLP